MTSILGTLIDLMVMGLLVVTIVYCVLLDRRLKRLKADELTMRATIQELVAATGIAERAIASLRRVAEETDRSLGQRLRDAERVSHDIERQLVDGEHVFARIAQITRAADRPAEPAPPASPPAASPSTADLRERAAAAAERLARLRQAGGAR